jgi:malate dehydrogenase (oxaloacetate-decarboxylating)(NADP+)
MDVGKWQSIRNVSSNVSMLTMLADCFLVDFSRRDYDGPTMSNLLDIITYVRPTALLGLSTTKVEFIYQSSLFIFSNRSQGAFTPEVIKAMSAINPRPIIFPLSNPVKLSECEFQEAVNHSNGSVLFASGSPFPEMDYEDRTLYPGQGNNMYIFPGRPSLYHEVVFIVNTNLGLGLGAILARASSVTDSMVEASSLGLAGSLSAEEESLDMLYPRIERIREISAVIATKVIRAAQTAVSPYSPL